MTRETKIGLLVGMGVIILIGILISDHLSVAQRQQQARVVRGIPELTPDQAPDPLAGIADPIAQDAPTPAPALGELPAPRHNDNAIASDPDVLRQHYHAAFDVTSARQGDELAAADTAVADTRIRTPPVADRTPPVDQRLANDPAFEVVRERPIPRDDVIRIREAAANATGAAPRQKTHTVKSGERLSDIANQYYGDPSLYTLIVQANKDKIPNPNVVRAGVRLVIPAKPSDEPAAAVGATPTTPGSTPPSTRGTTPTQPGTGAPTGQYADYTIKDGETLAGIAERYYGSKNAWRKLHEINKDRISNPDIVKPGTVIRVPRTR